MAFLLFIAWFTEALAVSKVLTTSRWPFWEAIYKGVYLSLSAWFTEAFEDKSVEIISG